MQTIFQAFFWLGVSGGASTIIEMGGKPAVAALQCAVAPHCRCRAAATAQCAVAPRCRRRVKWFGTNMYTRQQAANCAYVCLSRDSGMALIASMFGLHAAKPANNKPLHGLVNIIRGGVRRAIGWVQDT